MLNVAVVSAMFLLPVVVNAEEPAALMTQKEQLSYSLGAEFGKNLKKQGFEIDQDTLVKGMKDVLSNAKLLIPESEIRKTIAEFQLAQKFRRTALKNVS